MTTFDDIKNAIDTQIRCQGFADVRVGHTTFRVEGTADPVPDENGNDAYYEYWLQMCQLPVGADVDQDGQRITCARALQIAHEMIHTYLADGDLDEFMRTRHELSVTAGVLAGIRAQQGMEDHEPNCNYLTEFMDVVIYG